MNAAIGGPHKEFVPAHDEPVGSRAALDAMDHDPRSRAAVEAELTGVIAEEAPIAATRLARIVGRRFGLQRVAAKRMSDIIGLVPAAQVERSRFGVIVWAPDQNRDQYTEFRLSGDVALRTLDEIAPRELLNAMRYLAMTGAGISADELIHETGRLFGYSRMADKAHGHLDAIINHGMHEGVLRKDGSAIVIPSSNL